MMMMPGGLEDGVWAALPQMKMQVAGRAVEGLGRLLIVAGGGACEGLSWSPQLPGSPRGPNLSGG